MDSAIIKFEDTNYKFGCHISHSETPLKTFERAYNSPLRGWQTDVGKFCAQKHIPDLTEAREFLDRRGRYCYTHCTLFTNLATSDLSSIEKYRQQTITQMDYATIMGSKFIQHMGSNKDPEKGLATLIRSVNDLLGTPSKTTHTLSKKSGIDLLNERMLILENSAGEGNKIGWTLDEMQKIYMGVKEAYRPRLKFCIDTTHIFAAGQYDFGSSDGFETFLTDFDSAIGLDALECFHFNDSMVEFDSHIDRHQLMGQGHIFDENDPERKNAMKMFVEKCREEKWPFIYEPPSKKSLDPNTLSDCWLLLNSVCDISTCWC